MSNLQRSFEARLEMARERQRKIEKHQQEVDTHSKLKTRATWENKSLTATSNKKQTHHNNNNPLAPPPLDTYTPPPTVRKDTATLLKEEEEAQKHDLSEKRATALLKHTHMMELAQKRQIERERERSKVAEHSQHVRFERDSEEVRQHSSHIKARQLAKEWAQHVQQQQQKQVEAAKSTNTDDEVLCGMAAYFDQRQQENMARREALKQQTMQNLEAQMEIKEELMKQEEKKNDEEAILQLKQMHIDRLRAEEEELKRGMEERKERQEELQEEIKQRQQWRRIVQLYHSQLDKSVLDGALASTKASREEENRRREERRAVLEQDLSDHDRCEAERQQQGDEDDRKHLQELKQQAEIYDTKLQSILQQRQQAIHEMLVYNTKQRESQKQQQQQDKEQSKQERQGLEAQAHNDTLLSQSAQQENFRQEMLHKLELEAQIGARELRKKGEVVADLERAAAEAEQARQLAQRVARSLNDKKYLYPYHASTKN
jgi:hypothetical protein